jgi:hypothetical protein
VFAWLAVLPPSGAAGVLAEQGGAALREIVRDPTSIFSSRSPGARAPGALTQSKPHMKPWEPTERVLSPVLDRPGAAGPADAGGLPEQVASAVGPAAVGGTPGAGGTPVPLPIPGLPGSSGGLIPPGGGSSGGGSGGGSSGGGSSGGSSGGNPPPPPPPPVVSPVPEPATWVMMIVGVGMIGWQLRRRRVIVTTTTG